MDHKSSGINRPGTSLADVAQEIVRGTLNSENLAVER